MLALIIFNAFAAIFCGVIAGRDLEKENTWSCVWQIFLVVCNLSCMSININRYSKENFETSVVITNIEKDGKNISFSTTVNYSISADLESVSTQIGDTCIFNGKGELVKNISLETRISGE